MHEDHSHVHEHNGHTHEGLKKYTLEEAYKILEYTIEHNKHHGEDLHELYHAFEDNGKPEAAKLILEADHYFDHGNEKLAEALKVIGGDK